MTGVTLGLAAAVVIALAIWSARTGTIRRARGVFKEGGFRGLFRVYGWKAAAAIVLYYLVRDITLYIVVPWLVARGVLS